MSDEFKLSWILAGKLAALWKSTVSGSVIASILGFTVTESQTGDMRFAFLVAAFSGGAGAICATVPRLILAVKEARESKSRVHQSELNNVLSRTQEIHAKETETLKETVIWAQNQSALTRLSKHAALGEVNRLSMRNVILEFAIKAAEKDHGIAIEVPAEKQPFRDLHEVLAEEDNAMRVMLDKRITEGKPA